jgi:CBS domain-containing protein
MNDETQQDIVASLMIPLVRYPHLRAEATLREAILLIHQGIAKPELSGFRRALVLGKDNVLVGFINMPVLLLGLEPDILRTKPGGSYEGYVSQPGPESGMAVQVFWERVFTRGFGHEPERPVGEVAQPITVTVTPQDKLARALHLMLTERMLMLPVVENNRVLGVVRMIEIYERVVASITNNP